MSAIAFLAANLLGSRMTRDDQGVRGAQPGLPQFKTEFQQLGQDLQAGNLTQAQKDYATITQDVPGLSNSQNANDPVAPAFHQLGKDLQAGNLQGAQSDYATVQQDAQQGAAQAHGHHHHHHRAEDSDESGSNSQQNSINQAFSQLAQSLQAGNLSGAQSAFATLQNDLQQIGGFLPPFVAGVGGNASGAVAPSHSSSLSVSA